MQERQFLVKPTKFNRSIGQGVEKQRPRMSSLPTIADRNASAAPGHRNYRNKSLALTQKAKAIKKALDRRCSDYASIEPIDSGHFITTNMSFHETMETPDYSAYKRNFKRKTPFTQWSNAYFSGGVFFNPPVNGI